MMDGELRGRTMGEEGSMEAGSGCLAKSSHRPYTSRVWARDVSRNAN